MEGGEQVANHVLQNNNFLLCSVLEASEIVSAAVAKGLLSDDEGNEVERCVSEQGSGAGMSKVMELILRRPSSFNLFLEVLEDKEELKSWAAYLRNDYEMEMEVLKDMLDRKSFSSNPSTPIRTGPHLRFSDPSHDHEPSLRKEGEPVLPAFSSTCLLADFKKAQGRSVTTIRRLLQMYESQCILRSVYDVDMKSLLHLACELMDFRVVRMLVDKYNFNPNDQDIGGNTALHIACKAHKTQTVMYLLGTPTCNPNIRDRGGRTSLHIASTSSRNSITRFFLNCKRMDQEIVEEVRRTSVNFAEFVAASVRDNDKKTRKQLRPFKRSGTAFDEEDVVAGDRTESSVDQKESPIKCPLPNSCENALPSADLGATRSSGGSEQYRKDSRSHTSSGSERGSQGKEMSGNSSRSNLEAAAKENLKPRRLGEFARTADEQVEVTDLEEGGRAAKGCHGVTDKRVLTQETVVPNGGVSSEAHHVNGGLRKDQGAFGSGGKPMEKNGGVAEVDGGYPLTYTPLGGTVKGTGNGQLKELKFRDIEDSPSMAAINSVPWQSQEGRKERGEVAVDLPSGRCCHNYCSCCPWKRRMSYQTVAANQGSLCSYRLVQILPTILLPLLGMIAGIILLAAVIVFLIRQDNI